jgi:hypothetical protein
VLNAHATCVLGVDVEIGNLLLGYHRSDTRLLASRVVFPMHLESLAETPSVTLTPILVG